MDNSKKVTQWHLPEHTSQQQLNVAKNYSKISLSAPQRKALEDIISKEKEKGYIEGKREALQEILPLKNLIHQFFDDARKNLLFQQATLEQQGLAMVQQICRYILNHELSTNPECIKKLLTDAISHYTEDFLQFTIKANVKTLEILKQADIAHENIKFIEDNSLNLAQFKVESNHQVVAFDLEQALKNYFEQES